MDYDDLIFDFVDGSLETGKEDELFYLLSSNEELRGNFKRSLSIENSIKDNAKDIVPDKALTASVFAAAGFDYYPRPVEGGNGFLAKLSSGVAAHKSVLLSGLAASAITSIIMALLILPSFNNEITNENGSEADVLQMRTVDYGAFGGDDRVAHAPAKDTIIHFIVQDNTPTTNMQLKTKQGELLNREKAHALINWEEIIEYDTDNNFEYSDDFRAIDNIESTLDFNKNKKTKENILDGLIIEYRGFTDRHFKNPDIAPSRYADFNNNSIAAYYPISEHLLIGAGIRQENFYQKFEDDEKIYFQQPNFTSYGIGLRYINKLNTEEYRLISQLTFDATSVGGIGRFMLGGEYRLYEDISFILGLETSMMLYKFKSRYFTSGKTGLTFGVGYKF